MASLTEGKPQVEKLTSENYHDWAFDVKMLLMRGDCWSIVTGEETLFDDATNAVKMAFKKSENCALSTICLSVSKECKIYVRSQKVARKRGMH